MPFGLALSAASVALLGVASALPASAQGLMPPPTDVESKGVELTVESETTLDLKLIKAMKSKDHTTAVKKLKVALISRPSRTVVVSTFRTTTVRMVWRIKDPGNVAKRIKVCVEVPLTDVDRCKGQRLVNYAKPRGDFSMRRIKGGWEIVTEPYYKNISPASCNYFDYYRPRVTWRLVVVDPRNGGNAASAKRSWTLRCSG